MATKKKTVSYKKTTPLPKENPRTKEFSKWLLYQESILIWLVTITFLVLAFVCISQGYFGELPWLSAMAAFPWTAYGVSQAFYYKKAMAENTVGGIKHDCAMLENSINIEDANG